MEKRRERNIWRRGKNSENYIRRIILENYIKKYLEKKQKEKREEDELKKLKREADI